MAQAMWKCGGEKATKSRHVTTPAQGIVRSLTRHVEKLRHAGGTLAGSQRIPGRARGRSQSAASLLGFTSFPLRTLWFMTPEAPQSTSSCGPGPPGVRILLVEAAAAAAADRSRVLPRYSISLGLRFHLPAPWQPSNYPIKFIYYFMNT